MKNKQKEQSKRKWDEEKGSLAVDRKLIFRLFNPILKENDFILDIGCGDGIYLQDIKCKKVGLDISITNLKKAKQRNPNGLFVLGDAENLPFKNEIFDHTFIVQVLHHLPDYKRCFREVNRVLRVGAKLYIEGQNSDGWFLVYPFYKLAVFVVHLNGSFDEGPGIPLETGTNYLCNMGFNFKYIGSKGTSIKALWFSVLNSRIFGLVMPYNRETNLFDKPFLCLDDLLRKILPPKYLMWYKLEASKKLEDMEEQEHKIIRMEY